MFYVTNAFVRFVHREDGPTAVEYAVMLALIIVVCLAAVAIVGSGSSDLFNEAGIGAAPVADLPT
jgi:pilus assembly protein Flp/PilA